MRYCWLWGDTRKMPDWTLHDRLVQPVIELENWFHSFCSILPKPWLQTRWGYPLIGHDVRTVLVGAFSVTHPILTGFRKWLNVAITTLIKISHLAQVLNLNLGKLLR